MKKVISLLTLMVLVAIFALPASAQASTITFVNPPGDVLVLGVGESYTFEVEYHSDEPFLMAQLAFDQYYPGRSVFAQGVQSAHKTTDATLTLTITGKVPTAGLRGGDVAPVGVVAAIRYPGNQVVMEYFAFNVIVE